MSLQDEERLQALERELETVRAERDALADKQEQQAARARRKWRFRRKFAGFGMQTFAGPTLTGATRDAWDAWEGWLREGREGPAPTKPSRDFAAALLARITRVGLIGLFIALVPLLILAIQLWLLSNQNRLLENQNELMSSQNGLLRFETSLLSGQNDLVAEQTELFSGQNRLLEYEAGLLLSQNALILGQNDLASNQIELLSGQNLLIKEQSYILESSRRSALLFELTAILDEIDEELDVLHMNRGSSNLANSLPDQLSPHLEARIIALSRSLRPYRYLAGGEITERELSPERGQLLISLAETDLDISQVITLGDFSSADLSGADLSNLNLTGAKLIGADLSRANLTMSDLSSAYLSYASLREAKLYGAVLSDDIHGSAHMQYVEGLTADQICTAQGLVATTPSGASLDVVNLPGRLNEQVRLLCPDKFEVEREYYRRQRERDSLDSSIFRTNDNRLSTRSRGRTP